MHGKMRVPVDFTKSYQASREAPPRAFYSSDVDIESLLKIAGDKLNPKMCFRIGYFEIKLSQCRFERKMS